MGQEVTRHRPLFRQEVIEFQQHDRQWGRVVPLQPLSTRLLVWFIIASIAAVVTFLFFAQYARKETVAGYLASAAGTTKIFAPSQGTVSALYVEQGQFVQEGQPLMRVAVDQISTDGQDINLSILTTLARQRESLTRQMAVEEQRAVSERNRLTSQVQGIGSELEQLGAQLAIQADRIRVVERLVASGAQLASRGLVSEIEQRRREDTLLEQRQSLSSLRQQVVERQSQLNEIRFTLEQLPMTTAEKLQNLRNELASVEQRYAEVDGRRAYVIRAPISGYISSLQASVGKTVDPRHLQLQILPAGNTLQAELFIPARAIGFVEIGQPVRLLYDAFPYQQFGTYQGRITRVSQTILTPTDIATPVDLKEPAYRATVELERPDVDAYGRKIPLQPDMLLKADVILQKRTLVEWILNPLLSARIQG